MSFTSNLSLKKLLLAAVFVATPALADPPCPEATKIEGELKKAYDAFDKLNTKALMEKRNAQKQVILKLEADRTAAKKKCAAEAPK